jgi:hypothetical protein
MIDSVNSDSGVGNCGNDVYGGDGDISSGVVLLIIMK